MAIDFEKLLPMSSLFWGDKRFQGIIDPEQQSKLCNLELLEWLSGIYWGEGLAVKYSSKMFEISKGSERESYWFKIYNDELRHQAMISTWLSENNITPVPMNDLLNHCNYLIDKIDVGIANEELISIINSTQLYFEELLHTMIKKRLNLITDRDLQSILYVIMRDEASHISIGRKEIYFLESTPPNLFQTLKLNKNKIFPHFLAEGILSELQKDKVRKISGEIVNEFIELDISKRDTFSPVPILRDFLSISNYNCFATSPLRGDSVHIYPKVIENIVYDEFKFPKRFEGFNGIVHGGIVATSLDEMMFFSVVLLAGKLCFTKKIENINYYRPVKSGVDYRIEAELLSYRNRTYKVKSRIINSKDKSIYVSCSGEFFVPTLEIAQKLLGDLVKNKILNKLLKDSEMTNETVL